jgi:hypothetical protein
MPKKHHLELYIHEWAALAVLVGGIGMLAATAFFAAPSISLQLGEPHYLVDPTIEVFVIGEVAHAGPRRVPRGTTVEEVVYLAEPLENAFLDKLSRAKVRAHQVIKVVKKKAARKKQQKKSAKEPLKPVGQA